MITEKKKKNQLQQQKSKGLGKLIKKRFLVRILQNFFDS